ncbi:MAG: hypothetical protein AAB692_06075 [Patescibacteria group bacterium]
MSKRTFVVGVSVPDVLWPDELRPYVEGVLMPHGLVPNGIKVDVDQHDHKVGQAVTVYARCLAEESTAARLLEGLPGFSGVTPYDRAAHGGETEWHDARAWARWSETVGATNWSDALGKIFYLLCSILAAPFSALWQLFRGCGPMHLAYGYMLIGLRLIDAVKRLQILRRISGRKNTAP